LSARRGSRSRALAAALALAGLAAGTAAAGIPSAEKLAGAVAEANRKAGRAKPLLLEVTLRDASGGSLATGTLASHPTGLARLELRTSEGLERHLLQGSQYAASRNGSLLDAPRPLLPPLFLLQADSGASLRAALTSFGVAASGSHLGLADDRDCFVIGDRAPRAAGGGPAALARDAPAAAAFEPGTPSIWLEIGSFDWVEIDGLRGVRYRLGPSASFEGVRMPRWVDVQAPGQATLRLEIDRVARANAPAAAFGMEWLTSAP
jgi:hypothetical protein